MKTLFKKIYSNPIGSFVLTLAATLALLLGLMFATGLRLTAVQSGSMEPNVPTYSVCLIQTRVDYDDIQVGDVVVYHASGKDVIHRVIAKGADAAVTKGDANYVDDGPVVTRETLYGKYVAHVPHVARVVNFLRTPIGIALIVLACVAAVVPDIVKDAKAKKAAGQAQDAK